MSIAYDMPLFRPPSEGQNLIIQATLGCSFNRCTFCSMYKSKDYTARQLGHVFADIEAAAHAWPDAARVFLADGDALALPMKSLRTILEKLAETLPGLTRVSAYATPGNLLEKSVTELAELKALKLNLIYFGVESGASSVLKRIRKGATQKTLARAMKRAREGGLKVSATVILGLGGQNHWQDHITGTAELINMEPPTYLSTLQLFLEETAHEAFLAGQGEGFQFQDDAGILAEQELLLSLLDPPRPVIFRSNHASNCLALAGNLPKDKKRLLTEISAARTGAAPLRPIYSRGL